MSLGEPKVGRTVVEHLREIHAALDSRSVGVRLAVTLVAAVSVPLTATAVRRLGAELGLGAATLPLLVVAHVPAVVAVIAIWSVGCEVCGGGAGE